MHNVRSDMVLYITLGRYVLGLLYLVFRVWSLELGAGAGPFTKRCTQITESKSQLAFPDKLYYRTNNLLYLPSSDTASRPKDHVADREIQPGPKDDVHVFANLALACPRTPVHNIFNH